MNSHGMYTLLSPLREINFGLQRGALADLARRSDRRRRSRLVDYIVYYTLPRIARRAGPQRGALRPDPDPDPTIKKGRPEGRPVGRFCCYAAIYTPTILVNLL